MSIVVVSFSLGCNIIRTFITICCCDDVFFFFEGLSQLISFPRSSKTHIRSPLKQYSRDNEIRCGLQTWLKTASLMCDWRSLRLVSFSFKIDRLKFHRNLIKMDWQPGELLSVQRWEECFWFLLRRILHLPSSSFNMRAARLSCAPPSEALNALQTLFSSDNNILPGSF